MGNVIGFYPITDNLVAILLMRRSYQPTQGDRTMNVRFKNITTMIIILCCLLFLPVMAMATGGSATAFHTTLLRILVLVLLAFGFVISCKIIREALRK
jgi:uncharacterized membrane protein